MMPPLLQVKNLKTYFAAEHGIVKAIDGVSFEVQPGETLGLVGESGCGKSVTAMSIMRLIPDPPGRIIAGEILFEEKDLRRLDDQAVRAIRGNRIAMIFQEPMTSLNPVLTIGRQIAEPMEVHQGLTCKAALDRSKALLTQAGIAHAEYRLQAYPHHFSGGMRQRVMIAMGLACNPRLIIADEPTTALDVTVQAQLLELMKSLTRTHGASLILITHNLGVVARYADHIHVMYAGRIVEKGPVAAIFEDPCHPYTIGLMASVPRLDQDVRTKLKPIPGQPPDLADVPPGCAFHPRCAHAIRICRERRPELVRVAGDHEKACWIDVAD